MVLCGIRGISSQHAAQIGYRPTAVSTHAVAGFPQSLHFIGIKISNTEKGLFPATVVIMRCQALCQPDLGAVRTMF